MKILHMYYDLMNLYGEIGNIKALCINLDNLGIKYTLDNKTINDKIDINSYDFIYIGSGTKESELVVLKDILKYKDDFKKYIDSNKVILLTGNALELFGSNIEGVKALNIFKYNTRYIDKSLVGDLILNISFIDKKIIGFQNRRSIIENNDLLLFIEDNSYGVNKNNLYGTYQIGPVLVRNPLLLKYILECLNIDKDKIDKLDLDIEEKAYLSYLKTYYGE